MPINKLLYAIVHTTLKHNLAISGGSIHDEPIKDDGCDGDDEATTDDGGDDGCRPFKPKDLDLLVNLMKKMRNQELLYDMDVVKFYDYSPDALANRFGPWRENTWYFFTHPCKSGGGKKRMRRRTIAGKGYWKALSNEKPIRYGARHVGSRRPLVYYRRMGAGGSCRTNWFLHEFRVKTTQNSTKMDDLMLVKLAKIAKIPSTDVEDDVMEDATLGLDTLCIN